MATERQRDQMVEFVLRRAGLRQALVSKELGFQSTHVRGRRADGGGPAWHADGLVDVDLGHVFVDRAGWGEAKLCGDGLGGWRADGGVTAAQPDSSNAERTMAASWVFDRWGAVLVDSGVA